MGLIFLKIQTYLRLNQLIWDLQPQIAEDCLEWLQLTDSNSTHFGGMIIVFYLNILFNFYR